MDIKELKATLIETELVSAAQLDSLLADLPEDDPPADGEALLRLLIAQEIITFYQGQVLLRGKGRSLRLGKYLIQNKLGQGGMGMVFHAKHVSMKREVALKVVSGKVASNSELMQRFQREVQATAKLHHPNIVVAHDASEDRGTAYLVMEYIEGKDLSAIVKKKGPLTISQAINMIRQTALGLEYAHAQGVIHRDIKPSNLFLDHSGTVKILDMGLARFEDDEAAELTATGAVMGTIDYMAPEQAINTKDANAQSDIYSLGCTLWYLLLAKPMYGGESMIAKVLAHRSQPTPSLLDEREDFPEELQAIFEKMVAKKPENRYASMSELLADLDKFKSGDSELTAFKSSFTSDDDQLDEFLELTGAAADNPQGAAKTKSRSVPTMSDVDSDQEFQTFMMPPVVGRPTRVNRKKQSAWYQDWRVLSLSGAGLALILMIVLFTGGSGGSNSNDALEPDVGKVQQESVAQTEPDGDHPDATDDPTTDPNSEIPSNPEPSASQGLVSENSVQPDADKVTVMSPPANPELLLMEVELADTNPVEQENGWVSLFNGKDLTGWKSVTSDFSGWRVRRGILTGSVPTPNSRRQAPIHIFSEGGGYKDFHLYLETRIKSGGDSGLYFRSDFGLNNVSNISGLRYPKAYEAQIIAPSDPRDAKRTGTGYLIGLPNLRLSDSKPDTWVSLEVIAIGNRIVVRVDGQKTADCEDRDSKYRQGHFALQAGGSGWKTSVEFRKILVKDLSTERNDSPASMVRQWPSDAPPPAVAPFDADQANAHQDAWAKYLGVPVEYENSFGMKFRLIPPGEFLMGSTPEEIEAALKAADENEAEREIIQSGAPQHKVILTQPFYLGTTEVTRTQYEQVTGINPMTFSTEQGGNNHPVIAVSWRNAFQFCTTLSQKSQLMPFDFQSGVSIVQREGTGYRLPTEAEWEYACRAGTVTRFWSGDQADDLLSAGWFQSNAGNELTHAVGELEANPFGLYDVHGNVSEWVFDSWDAGFYAKFEHESAINPLSSDLGDPRQVVRGGDWKSSRDLYCSSSRRAFRKSRFDRVPYIGFRVILPVDVVMKMSTRPSAATASKPDPVPNGSPNGELLKKTLSGHSGNVYSIAYSPDGTLLASGGVGEVCVWDAESGELRYKLPLSGDDWCMALTFSPDSKYLLTAPESRDVATSISVWEAETGKSNGVLNGHRAGLYALSFSPDGKTLVSAGWDMFAITWNFETRRKLKEIPAIGGGWSRSAIYANDGKVALGQEKVYLFKSNGKLIRSIDLPAAPLAFSKDSRYLAGSTWKEGLVTLWDADTGREIASWRAHSGVANSVTFSHNHQVLVTAGGDRRAKLWDVKTQRLLRELPHDAEVYGVTFSPDGNTLASCGYDHLVKLWDVSQLPEMKPIEPIKTDK